MKLLTLTQFNDGMTITPGVFIRKNQLWYSDDDTGVLVKTSFSF